MASANQEEVSVLYHSVSTAVEGDTPTYTVYPEGDYNYVFQSENPTTLTATDGAQVNVSTSVLKESSEYTDYNGATKYNNYFDTVTPVSVSPGHLAQLPTPTAQQQPDGSFAEDYYYYGYQNADSTGSAPTSTGPSSGSSSGSSSSSGTGNGGASNGGTSGSASSTTTSSSSIDTFDVDGVAYQIVDGVPQGTISSTDGSVTSIDPTTLSVVQLDYDLSGQASQPITSTPLVDNDTGHSIIDGVSTWWDQGGGVDISNGNVGSLLSDEAALHPVQQQLLDQISLFSDTSSLSTTLSVDDPAYQDVQDYYAHVVNPVRNLIGGELDGSATTLDERTDARAIAGDTVGFESTLLADEQNNQIGSVQSALQTINIDEGRALELDLVNQGTAALRLENAGTELYGTVDSLATGAVSAVGLTVAAKQIAEGDTVNGVTGLVQNIGTLSSALGAENGGAVGTALAQGIQIAAAYEQGDSVKLASALAKGSVVLAFTTIGALEGNADAGATLGDNAAKAADKLGNALASSDAFNTFLDNHEALLQAYNKNGFVGVQDLVVHQIVSAMPEGAQSAVTNLFNYTPGLNLLVGVNAAEHFFYHQ